MRKNLLLALLLILLLPAVSAQDVPPDFCFDLPAEDCAIIDVASTLTRDSLRSFEAFFGLDFTINGMDALGLGEDFDFAVSGNGPFQLVEDRALTASAFAVTLLADIDEQTATVNTVLQDGDFYIQVDGSEWRGGDLIEAFNQLQEALSSMGGLPVTMPMQALLTEPVRLEDGETLAIGLPDLSPLIAGLGALEANLPGMIAYNRLPDQDNAEQTLYPFELVVDFRPLLTSDSFRDGLQQALSLASQFDPSAADVSDIIALVLPSILEQSDAQLRITQYVGTDDGLIRGLDMTFAGEIDLSPLFASEPGTDIITFALVFSVDLDAINQPAEIDVPDNFAPLLEGLETGS